MLSGMRPTFFRPSLEALEDRCLAAALTDPAVFSRLKDAVQAALTRGGEGAGDLVKADLRRLEASLVRKIGAPQATPLRPAGNGPVTASPSRKAPESVQTRAVLHMTKSYEESVKLSDLVFSVTPHPAPSPHVRPGKKGK